jgi:hypothetical protein
LGSNTTAKRMGSTFGSCRSSPRRGREPMFEAR